MRIAIEQWDQIVEEFGEDAYKRVRGEVGFGTKFNLRNNENALDYIAKKTFYVESRPIPESIAHDIEFYGEENAKKMYSGGVSYDDTSSGETIFSGYVEASELDGNLIDFPHTVDAVWRKTSAALPFDLDRSVNGASIQCKMINGEWLDCKFLKETDMSGTYLVIINDINFLMKECDLCMKFPPRAKK